MIAPPRLARRRDCGGTKPRQYDSSSIAQSSNAWLAKEDGLIMMMSVSLRLAESFSISIHKDSPKSESCDIF